MNFQRSGVIFVLIIIASSSTSTAQTIGECRLNVPCFDPDLSLGVGDIFHWNVVGQNISEQANGFEWEELMLTHIKLEITEDIRGLSASVARNFARYFNLIYTLDGNQVEYSELINGLLYAGKGIVFDLLSYTTNMDHNGDLTNVFIREVADARNWTFSFSFDRFNQTFHELSSEDSVIEDGIFTRTHISYQFVTPDDDSNEILSSTEIITKTSIEVETGVLILRNETKILFDQTLGSWTSQNIIILEQDGNKVVEFSLGDFDWSKIIIFIGLTIGVMTAVFVLAKKYM